MSGTVTGYGAFVAVQLVTPGAGTASVYGVAVYRSGARYSGAWPWTSVECAVTSATWTAGGGTPAGPLTRVESATLNVDLWDPTGQWAPHLGRLPLRTPIRLLAGASALAAVPVWTGWLEQVQWQPAPDGGWTVSLSAADVIRQLSAWPTVGMARPAETAAARLAGLAAAVPANTGGPVPYPTLGPYTASNRPLVAVTVDGSVWDGMQDVADADLSWLRAGPDAVVAGVALPTAPSALLTPCPDPAHPPGPLGYAWTWSTGTGTVAATPAGVLLTPDPRSTAANWTARARTAAVLPVGTAYRAICRARLTAGTPNGILQLLVGTASQAPPSGRVVVTVPTDGSWVTLDGSALVPAGATGDNAKGIVYLTTGGTAQVTVAVEGLLLWDAAQVVYADRTDELTADAIVNSVSVTRVVPDGQTEPPPVTRTAGDSIARYLPAGLERTLPLPDDTAAGTWAGQVLGWLANPRPHTATATLLASPAQGNDPATLDLMARIYPPARVTVRGDAGDVEHLVIGVTHDLRPESWQADLTLMPAPYDSTQVYGRPRYAQVRYGGVSA